MYEERQVGPMDMAQMRAYDITPRTMVWTDGMADWEPAYTVPELMVMLKGGDKPHAQDVKIEYTDVEQPQYNDANHTTICPPHDSQRTDNYRPASQKDHIVAGVLALLLGELGVHYFYMGKTGAGFITILLELVTCGIWSVIPFVQGIVMLVMNQQDFERKYVNNPSTFPIF